MVSIIIPFYRNIQWLEEAVESVLKQTFRDYEVIIVNDGSPEDDTQFLKKFGTSISYFKIPNGGPAAARNKGISLAKGKYVAFLDSDDFWLPEKLEKQFELMERTGAVWSHTNYFKFIDGKPEEAVEQDLEKYSGKIFPMSLLSTHIATPCVMVRRDIFEKRPELRFQEKMRYGQDYFLWLALSVEEPLHLVPEPLAMVRLRGTNANSRARAHIQVRAQAWNELKSNKTNFFYSPESNAFLRGLYRLCHFEHKILLRIEGVIRNRNFIEYLAKVMYVIPFLGFKGMHRILLKRKS